MKITTNVKGQLAQSKAELRAFELGFVPSKPIFNARYDLILDNGSELKRIQIKYADAKLSNSTGAVAVKLAYQNRKRQVFTYKSSEIDGLVVYIPKIDKLCFLPPNLFLGKARITIRYCGSKNNQKQGIIYAEDYLW